MRYRDVNGTKHPTACAAAGAVCRAVVLCAGSVVLSAAVAAEYSWQVTGGYSLSGALFPTQALGVRLTYTNSDHDTYGISDVVGLSANRFFVRNAAIEIQLVRTDSGGGYFTGAPDSDSLGVRLLGRF